MDERDDDRERASVLCLSSEADPSFLLLLKDVLGERQAGVRALNRAAGPPAAAVPAERIGRFEVIDVLGRGGYGTVLRVRDLTLGCERAMKVPNPETLASPRSLARFIDEARKAVLIDHPNVVRVVEADEVCALHYMVMEYCPAGSLAGWLAHRPVNQPIPPRWAAALVAEIADGVQQAHSAGLLHRDLKPGNVMLVRLDDRSEADPPRFHAKVGDFGLAKALGEGPGRFDPTASGAMIGTLAYMSPEQARGDKAIGAAADIHGLGTILYELLTRTTPFASGNEAETLGRILDDAPPPSPRALRSDVPRDLEKICVTALAKRPGDRYRSAAELADDLRRFLRDEPVKGSPWWKRAGAQVRRHRSRVAAAAFVVTALAVSVVAWIQNRDFRDRGEVEVLFNNLESASVARFPDLVPRIDPRRRDLGDRLQGLFITGTENQKLGAALALAGVRHEYGDYCYDRLLKGVPGEIVPVARLLATGMPDLRARLVTELESRPEAGLPPDLERDRRHARAACALVALWGDEHGWSLLRFAPDPQARSLLIHLLGAAGVSPALMIERLRVEPVASMRGALIQCLGEVGPSAWTAEERQEAIRLVLDLYKRDPDPGTHGSAKWLLNRWDMAGDLRVIDNRIAGAPAAPSRRWRIGPLRLTFVTIDDPLLDRVIEISDSEITVDQFLFFCPDHNVDRTVSPERTCPINATSYVDAAAFCNWLSDGDGYACGDWCYQPHPENPKLMASVRDFRDRPGYRLPDAVEARLAARAGTISRCFFGGPEELVGHYAWCLENHNGRAHPVGQLKPNALGLFDALGNVIEWCEVKAWSAWGKNQALSGFSFTQNARNLDQTGPGYLRPAPKYIGFQNYGFRVARTVGARRSAASRDSKTGGGDSAVAEHENGR